MGEMSDVLTLVDVDISQAIQVDISTQNFHDILISPPRQSSKEEIDAGRVSDMAAARYSVNNLRAAVKDSLLDCEAWGGEFPFERASASIEFWKI